jgi:hypothetical protein
MFIKADEGRRWGMLIMMAVMSLLAYILKRLGKLNG